MSDACTAAVVKIGCIFLAILFEVYMVLGTFVVLFLSIGWYDGRVSGYYVLGYSLNVLVLQAAIIVVMWIERNADALVRRTYFVRG